jgi:hypothetical protein
MKVYHYLAGYRCGLAVFEDMQLGWKRKVSQ